jgi:hypothetical protein
MARASEQLGSSFNALLREHLRGRKPIDRPRALLLLHTHFGDRVGAAFGRTEQLLGLLDGPKRVEMTDEARRLVERACAVQTHFLGADSEKNAALRRADLLLGAGGGLRAVLALPSNGGRLVALLVQGLAPEAAAAWVESGGRRMEVAVLLGPEELELCELLPLLGKPEAAEAPLLGLVPQGRLRPEGCRWLHESGPERLSGLVSEALEACGRLLGVPELERGRLAVRAVATGGLALANALAAEPDLEPDAIEVEDGLYGALPELLAERCRQRPRMRVRLDVLPHQAEAAALVAGACAPGQLELRRTRPIDRVRQLRYNTPTS